jgi:hypothetical protein
VPTSLDLTVTPLAVVTLDVATVGVGAAVSIVIDRAVEVVALPAASVSVTEILHVPGAKVANVQAFDEIVHVTLVDPTFVAVTTAVPEKVPETLIVGVSSEVMLSVFNVLGVSDDESRSGVDGVLGAVVSTTIALFAPNDPAASGDASVNTAFAFEEFLIVPLFSTSELVAT